MSRSDRGTYKTSESPWCCIAGPPSRVVRSVSRPLHPVKPEGPSLYAAVPFLLFSFDHHAQDQTDPQPFEESYDIAPPFPRKSPDRLIMHMRSPEIVPAVYLHFVPNFKGFPLNASLWHPLCSMRKTERSRTRYLTGDERMNSMRGGDAMKRPLMILAVLAVLATPLMVRADDDGDSSIPAELNWTPYPPAGGSIEMTQLVEFRRALAEMLEKTAAAVSDEQARLTQPEATIPDVHSSENR